jgi:toxin FitB
MNKTTWTGHSMSIVDGFLAATAEVHRLTMITRNSSDFSVLGHRVFNPWTA